MLRAGLLKLGGSMLGSCCPPTPAARPAGAVRQGHEAEFTDYRDKTFDTVLGPVTLRRAWYGCAECKHGFRRAIPSSAWPDVPVPGLAAINDITAATGPFAKAAGLLETWPGSS